jgi:hypothetical protein
LNIPLRGPKSSATLRVSAGKGKGPWVLSVLDVVVEGQLKPIDLVRGKLEVTSDKAYVDIHTQPAVAPELLDTVPPVPTWNGAYPVMRIIPLVNANGQIKFAHSFATSKPSVKHDSPVNSFEVDLRSGMFVLRQTDLFVEDVMPLSLTRTSGLRAVIRSTPLGHLDPMRFVRVHRSSIVNIDSILELQPISHGEFELVLKDGHRSRVSRNYRIHLEKRLGQSL